MKTNDTSRPIIKVVLAEDHVLVREALAMALEEEDNLHVVGQADNGANLIRLAGDLLPDIVVTDLQMPVMDGYEAIRVLLKTIPSVRIIALSMHNEVSLVQQLLKDGLSAYLIKNCPLDELIFAINSVYTTGHYYAHVAQTEIHKRSGKNNFSDVQALLSERERAVLKQICSGRSNKEIADRLCVSIDTVDFHKKNIRKKTNLYSTADLILYAVKNGLRDFS